MLERRRCAARRLRVPGLRRCGQRDSDRRGARVRCRSGLGLRRSQKNVRQRQYADARYRKPFVPIAEKVLQRAPLASAAELMLHADLGRVALMNADKLDTAAGTWHVLTPTHSPTVKRLRHQRQKHYEPARHWPSGRQCRRYYCVATDWVAQRADAADADFDDVAAASGPTPEGVPVAITSPGSSVITCAIQRIITSTEKIISDVWPTVS